MPFGTPEARIAAELAETLAAIPMFYKELIIGLLMMHHHHQHIASQHQRHPHA